MRSTLALGVLMAAIVVGAYFLLLGGRGTSAPRKPRPTLAAASPARGASPSPAPAVPSPQGSPAIVFTQGSPSPQGGAPGPGSAPLHMREYLAGIAALEKDPKLALTPQQAARLLPLLEKYSSVYGAVPESRDQIVAVLDPAQRAWLEKSVPRRPPSPDPTRSAEQILIDACRRVLSALEGR